MPKLSRFTRFSSGKIWFQGFALWRRIDISQLWAKVIHYMTTKPTIMTKLKLKQAERDGPSVVVLGGFPTAIGGFVLVFIKWSSKSHQILIKIITKLRLGGSVLVFISAPITATLINITIERYSSSSNPSANHHHLILIKMIIKSPPLKNRYSHDSHIYQVTGESYDPDADRWWFVCDGRCSWCLGMVVFMMVLFELVPSYWQSCER